VGRLHGCVVAVLDTEGEPSLLALWILGLGQFEILINLSKNCRIGALIVDEILEEYDLKVAIEFSGEVLVIFWGSCTGHLNVLVSEEVSKVGTRGAEVRCIWGKSGRIEPSIPVDVREYSIGLSSIKIIFNEVFPLHSYHTGPD